MNKLLKLQTQRKKKINTGNKKKELISLQITIISDY